MKKTLREILKQLVLIRKELQAIRSSMEHEIRITQSPSETYKSVHDALSKSKVTAQLTPQKIENGFAECKVRLVAEQSD